MEREALFPGRNHLTVTRKFQSDKFDWCPDNMVPLKIVDKDARPLLEQYGFLFPGAAEDFPLAFILLDIRNSLARKLLREYAFLRTAKDPEFGCDLVVAIEAFEADKAAKV